MATVVADKVTESESASIAEAVKLANEALRAPAEAPSEPANTPEPTEPAAGDAASEEPAKEPAEAPAEPAAEAAAEDPDSLAIVMRAKRNARRIEEKARSEAEARLADIERKAAELEAKNKQLLSQLTQDPIAALRELGYTEEQIARRLLGQEDKPKDAVAARLAQLEEQFNKRIKEEEDRRKAAESAQAAQAMDAARRSFVGYVARNDSEFPMLVAFYDEEPERLADEAFSIANTYKERTGKEPSYNDVAAYLEQTLTQRYNNIQKRTGKVAAEDHKPNKQGRTVTPAAASQRASKPAKTPETEEERRAAAAALAAEVLGKR